MQFTALACSVVVHQYRTADDFAMSTPPANEFREFDSAASVAAWFQFLGGRPTDLFSTALRPGAMISEVIVTAPSWPGRGDIPTRRTIRGLVEQTCRRRQELLRTQNLDLTDVADLRRLIFYPDFTDFSGLAEETGIVDAADVPPWDLWTATAVHDGHFCLVSYVPPALSEPASRAIDLSTMFALTWCEVSSLSVDGS
jgi:hypothetical protein